MKRAGILIVASLLPFLFDVCLAQTPDQKQKEWTWKDGHGRTRTEAELKTLILNHQKWLSATIFFGTCRDRNGRVLLSDASAKLAHADLSTDGFSPLSNADLRCANLIGINLSGSQVLGTDLRGAILSHAKLKKTTFVGSNLRGASLDQADLEGAVLAAVPPGMPDADVDLSETQFQVANLSGATFFNVDLNNAQFWDADLHNVKFEPRSNPSLRSIAAARNLETMTYARNPDALTQLRNDFKNAGFRDQERKITFAIERRRVELLRNDCSFWPWRKLQDCVEYGINRFLFDLPCQYGMSPGRTLLILSTLLVVFSLPYMIFLKKDDGAGICAVWQEDRVNKAEGVDRPVRVSEEFFFPSLNHARTIWGGLFRWLHLRLLFGGLYFSLLATFHIGWRDLNFGNWIVRMQPREYTLRATGWCRLMSGFQSLMSVYLLALGILTYFGRPFE